MNKEDEYFLSKEFKHIETGSRGYLFAFLLILGVIVFILVLIYPQTIDSILRKAIIGLFKVLGLVENIDLF